MRGSSAMEQIMRQYLTGERALFQGGDLEFRGDCSEENDWQAD